MLCLSVALLGLSLHHLWIGSTPEIIPIIMLLASLSLVIGFSFAFLRIKPLHRITVVMLDGSSVTLTRSKKPVALELLQGLTDAMDWHRIGTIELDAQRASHLRQGVARGRQQGPGVHAGSKSSTGSSGRSTGAHGKTRSQSQSSESSRESSRESAQRRSAERRRRAGRVVSGWLVRAQRRWRQVPRSAQSSDVKGTAEASPRQASSEGPVVVMREQTLGVRLKGLYARLRALFVE